jgi:hypothetical protein
MPSKIRGDFQDRDSLTDSKFRKYVEKSKEKTKIVCAHIMLVHANIGFLSWKWLFPDLTEYP